MVPIVCVCGGGEGKQRTGWLFPQGCVRAPSLGLRSSFSPRQLEQFRDNNKDVGFGSATRALEQALEKTKANIKWVKENKEVVLEWFTENSK